MKFSDVARYFDTDPVYDGYTAALLFRAQSASFDDSTADGATARRRVLSVAPGISMPARHVISIYDERWLVGLGTVDGFEGSSIRQHYVMKRVTDQLAVLTPSQALAAAAGTTAYAHKVFLKDIVNSLTDSEYDPQYNIFFSPAEAVSKGTFLRDTAGNLYRVRNTYVPVESLTVAQSDLLDAGARQTCVINSGAYDPVTEAVTAGTTSVNAIWLDTPKFYRFRHLSDQRIEAGDRALFVPSNVAAGTTLTFDGALWVVLSSQPEGDAWALHVRLA